MSNWAFFPLYPLLLHVIALPFGSNIDTYRFVGIVLSNGAALGAAIYLYKLTVKELGRTIAARAVLYLLLLIYGIFALAYLIMPLTSGQLNSIARYYLPVFPVFLILAYWRTGGNQEQQARRHSLIVATFAILLSLGMVLFTLGVFSIA